MANIDYTTSLGSITTKQLKGFFVDWPNPPSPETHLRLLHNSDHVILAMDNEKVVGFITAHTDKVLSAYIPFLEVLPDYQKLGLGKELTKKMLIQLKAYYMIDLLCDEDIQPFYEKLQMQRATGMLIRNYDKQSGK